MAFDFSNDDQGGWGQEKAETSVPLKPLSLPTRRKKASKEEIEATVAALDLSSLAVLPPEITTQLSWRQEYWLVARLQTYSDNQANLHIGISKWKLKEWRATSEAFEKAYHVITLDKLNLSLQLNRLLLVKTKLRQMELLEHPSVAVQLKVMDQVSKEIVAANAAESKIKSQTNNTINVFDPEIARIAFEKLRDGGLLGAGDQSFVDVGATVSGLLPDSFTPEELGEVRTDQGRDDPE